MKHSKTVTIRELFQKFGLLETNASNMAITVKTEPALEHYPADRIKITDLDRLIQLNWETDQ